MTQVSLNMKIDKNLRDQLKIIAIEKDTTITEIITDFVKQYVEENKK